MAEIGSSESTEFAVFALEIIVSGRERAHIKPITTIPQPINSGIHGLKDISPELMAPARRLET
jgi:hypothetical protein